MSLLSKHLIRPTGRHLFNPSNVGILWCLLVVGPNHVFAQYLWWGPSLADQVLAYAVIVAGTVWLLRAVRMIPMALAFLGTFAVLTGLFALGGREFLAIWHDGPVGGIEYWVNPALSPEVFVFVFFMISDPQTAPKVPEGRVIYGAAVAALAAVLIAAQRTEFGIKVAILVSLTVVCAVVPFIETAIRRRRERADQWSEVSAVGATTALAHPGGGDGPEARRCRRPDHRRGRADRHGGIVGQQAGDSHRAGPGRRGQRPAGRLQTHGHPGNVPRRRRVPDT